MIEISTYTDGNEFNNWNIVLGIDAEKNNIEQYGDFSEEQCLKLLRDLQLATSHIAELLKEKGVIIKNKGKQ